MRVKGGGEVRDRTAESGAARVLSGWGRARPSPPGEVHRLLGLEHARARRRALVQEAVLEQAARVPPRELGRRRRFRSRRRRRRARLGPRHRRRGEVLSLSRRMGKGPGRVSSRASDHTSRCQAGVRCLTPPHGLRGCSWATHQRGNLRHEVRLRLRRPRALQLQLVLQPLHGLRQLAHHLSLSRRRHRRAAVAMMVAQRRRWQWRWR